MEDRPPLRVVEACRPVEHAKEEEARCGGSNHLETMAPSDRSEGNQITDTDMIWPIHEVCGHGDGDGGGVVVVEVMVDMVVMGMVMVG